MIKFSKITKRILSLFLVAILNTTSYAAVGGNDGSAFVTKAEFDAELQKGVDSIKNGRTHSVEDVDRMLAEEFDI